MLSLFHKEFYKCNNTGAQMLDFIYHKILKCLKVAFFRESVKIFPIYNAMI